MVKIVLFSILHILLLKVRLLSYLVSKGLLGEKCIALLQKLWREASGKHSVLS